jgi:hypothetical protein
MLQITENEIKKRLAFDNPWWEEGAVFERVRAMPRRAYFDGFMKLLKETSVNRALVLMGPRRVGKTIMLTQAVQKLIDDRIAPNRIFYVSVDTPTYTGLSLEKLLALYLESHGHDRREPLYVFYDEIQYHPDWEGHLKSLVDSHPEFRFVVSGSAAAAPRMRGRESGAGRFTNFPLPPLDFAEFLQFRKLEDSLIDRKNLKVRDIDALNAAFIDYLNFGGFPEVVLDPAVRGDMNRFVANDIVDKVLLRDLPSVYGITDTQELKRLFTTLAYNTGNEVTYQALSQTIGIAKNTLRRYLDYLEAAFLIHRHHRVDQDAKRFERATRFKVYLTNPCIRAALFGPVGPQDEAMGRLAETSLVSQLAQSAVAANCFYANWKTGAVDLVLLHAVTEKPMGAWEIEWGDGAAHRPRETLRSLIEFCDKHGLQEASVSVKSISKKEVVDGIKIRFIPNSFASYILPVFTIESVLRVGLRRTPGANST